MDSGSLCGLLEDGLRNADSVAVAACRRIADGVAGACVRVCGIALLRTEVGAALITNADARRAVRAVPEHTGSFIAIRRVAGRVEQGGVGHIAGFAEIVGTAGDEGGAGERDETDEGAKSGLHDGRGAQRVAHTGEWIRNVAAPDAGVNEDVGVVGKGWGVSGRVA